MIPYQILQAGLKDTHTEKPMDRFSMSLANALLGNPLDQACLEVHFPAAKIKWNNNTWFCLCGADFTARLNDLSIPNNRPILAPKGSVLTFQAPVKGASAYVATADYPFPLYEAKCLPWSANLAWEKTPCHLIHVLPGRDWERLTSRAQQQFFSHIQYLSHEANRMGFRLEHPPLQVRNKEDILSTAASFGTVQLTHAGQMIILMADHQLTGGYPIIAHVISADLPKLAQKRPGEPIQFNLCDQSTAENLWKSQQFHLQQIQSASILKIRSYAN